MEAEKYWPDEAAKEAPQVVEATLNELLEQVVWNTSTDPILQIPQVEQCLANIPRHTHTPLRSCWPLPQFTDARDKPHTNAPWVGAGGAGTAGTSRPRRSRGRTCSHGTTFPGCHHTVTSTARSSSTASGPSGTFAARRGRSGRPSGRRRASAGTTSPGRRPSSQSDLHGSALYCLQPRYAIQA